MQCSREPVSLRVLPSSSQQPLRTGPHWRLPYVTNINTHTHTLRALTNGWVDRCLGYIQTSAFWRLRGCFSRVPTSSYPNAHIRERMGLNTKRIRPLVPHTLANPHTHLGVQPPEYAARERRWLPYPNRHPPDCIRNGKRLPSVPPPSAMEGGANPHTHLALLRP